MCTGLYLAKTLGKAFKSGHVRKCAVTHIHTKNPQNISIYINSLQSFSLGFSFVCLPKQVGFGDRIGTSSPEDGLRFMLLSCMMQQVGGQRDAFHSVSFFWWL